MRKRDHVTRAVCLFFVFFKSSTVREMLSQKQLQLGYTWNRKWILKYSNLKFKLGQGLIREYFSSNYTRLLLCHRSTRTDLGELLLSVECKVLQINTNVDGLELFILYMELQFYSYIILSLQIWIVPNNCNSPQKFQKNKKTKIMYTHNWCVLLDHLVQPTPCPMVPLKQKSTGF